MGTYFYNYISFVILLKCKFLKKSFIMNAPLASCPFPVITFGWVQQQTHPKVMTGNGQLTRGAFIINEFLKNPHFSGWADPEAVQKCQALYNSRVTEIQRETKIFAYVFGVFNDPLSFKGFQMNSLKFRTQRDLYFQVHTLESEIDVPPWINVAPGKIHIGGFQLEFVRVSQFINHIICYKCSALISWNYSIQTGEKIL